MGRVFTIGEALIDFIPLEIKDSLKEVGSFAKMPGGAPANVAVTASKLGSKSYFIGMLGEDSFGNFLFDTLNKYGVDTAYIYKTSKAKTALAFVSLGKDGSRDFSFYRDPSADLFLSVENVKNIDFRSDDYISFCSVDLVPYPVKDATEYLLKKAKSSNATILFDPNIRKNLWNDMNLYRETVLYFMKYADILKISDDEIEFITGKSDIDEGIEFLKSLGVKNIILTLGKNGASAYFDNKYSHIDGISVIPIDTTGAGDSFVGAVLHMLDIIGKKPDDLSKSELDEILNFANKVGALVSTKKGAIDSLPTKEEALNFIID
ncbi:carbohydrate kinase family protein [Peptoanaerobacter stomatis]|jgi:fructokinase